jgi:hypothetical protein
MGNTHQSAAANGRLDSWKDIAAYLGRDVRTVIRWQEKGLPVHRVPGGKRQAVFAYRTEIDDWLHGKSNSPTVGLAEPKRGNSVVLVSPSTGRVLEEDSKRKAESRKHPRLAAVGTLIIGIVSAAVFFLPPSRSVQIARVTRLSRDAQFKIGLATDGANIYFGEYLEGKIRLSWMGVGGGAIGHIPTPFSQASLQDIYAGGRELLVEGRDGREYEASLWIVPADGRPSRRVGDVTCHSAARSPDGRAIAYSQGNRILITLDEGATSHELGHFDTEPNDLHFSKTTNSLRFVLQNFATTDLKALQIELDDHFNVVGTSRLPFRPESCCIDSVETPDYEFFTTKGSKDQLQLWAFPKHHHWWKRDRAQSVDLPTPLGSLSGLAADMRTGRMFAIGGEPDRGELVRFERFSRTFAPFLPGISALFPDVSGDGKWVTYVDNEGSLWMSRADSSDRKQLTSAFETIELPKWSPDGTEIAFTAKDPSRPWRIYVLSAQGGMPHEVSSGDENQGAPTWSPDGKWLAYANVSCQSRNECAVHRIELATGKIETLPGSSGLRTARWSPDGRYIAALQGEQHELYVFDVAKQSWRKLSDSITGDDLGWSYDSRYIYSNRPIGDKPEIFRIPVKGGKAERIVDLKTLSRLAGKYDTGLCIAPDDSVILLRQINSSEIYALDWDLR